MTQLIAEKQTKNKKLLTMSAIDIYKIQNKKIKTYRKIGGMFIDLAQKYESGEITEDINIRYIYKNYNIESRTQNRYFREFLEFINKRRTILDFRKIDIFLIKDIIRIFSEYSQLSKKQAKLAKYVIYYLLELEKNKGPN